MNPSETPYVIAASPVGFLESYDVPQLEFDHKRGDWAESRIDEYNMFVDARALQGLGRPFGQSVTVCPTCAFFADGRCEWCPGEYDPGYPSDRPECHGCLGQQRPSKPWYQRSEVMVPLLTTVAVTTVATVASTILLKRFGVRG